MTTRQNVTRSPLIQTKETTPSSISYTSHGQPQIISLSAPLPSNPVSQLSKGNPFAKNTFLCHIFHLPLVQPDDSASVSDSSSSGCVNSCCAVCIPDKNCEVSKISFHSTCFFLPLSYPKMFECIFSSYNFQVCYQLNRNDPDNCPCIDSLSHNQRQSLLNFQQFFKNKNHDYFNNEKTKDGESKEEFPWKDSITLDSGKQYSL